MGNRVYDGREHKVSTECPECGYPQTHRISWSEQGVKCHECGSCFNAVNNEIN